MAKGGHTVGTTRRPQAQRGDDLYQTPREAVLTLLAVDNVPTAVWEPACGPGAIVRVLRERRHNVLATDINAYTTPYQDRWGKDWDYVKRPVLPDERAIVTNPPYHIADKFVRRALQGSDYVAMLLRFNFYTGQRRADIMETPKLARIHVFSRRLPMMHHESFAGKRAGSQMDFAWFVWQRNHDFGPAIQRVDWRDYA